MAIPHSMSREEHRTALTRSKKEIEADMYAIATTLGLDAHAMNYSIPEILWQTDTPGVFKIDDYSEEDKRPYVELMHLSQHYKKIIEKLEGPNRVV